MCLSILRKLVALRCYLNYRQAEMFSREMESNSGITKGLIHFNYPYYIYGEQYMRFLGRFYACTGARIECISQYAKEEYKPKLVFGNNVTLNYFCHIGCINEITIGDNVLMGSRVLITDHQHGLFNDEEKDIPWVERHLSSKGPVHIEDNVWLGENVCVMPNVTIGKGSVVGANAVVTHDIPPYSMAVGNPAKVIRTLSIE